MNKLTEVLLLVLAGLVVLVGLPATRLGSDAQRQYTILSYAVGGIQSSSSSGGHYMISGATTHDAQGPMVKGKFRMEAGFIATTNHESSQGEIRLLLPALHK